MRRRHEPEPPDLPYDGNACLVCGGRACRAFGVEDVPELFAFLFRSMHRADFVRAVVTRLRLRSCATAPKSGVSVCTEEITVLALERGADRSLLQSLEEERSR